jgi:hypothetical protein
MYTVSSNSGSYVKLCASRLRDLPFDHLLRITQLKHPPAAILRSPVIRGPEYDPIWWNIGIVPCFIWLGRCGGLHSKLSGDRGNQK